MRTWQTFTPTTTYDTPTTNNNSFVSLQRKEGYPCAIDSQKPRDKLHAAVADDRPNVYPAKTHKTIAAVAYKSLAWSYGQAACCSFLKDCSNAAAGPARAQKVHVYNCVSVNADRIACMFVFDVFPCVNCSMTKPSLDLLG